MPRYGGCFLVSNTLLNCQEGDHRSGRNIFMIKNEPQLHLLQEGGSHHLRSPRQMDENSAYEVTAPLLIRGEGSSHTEADLTSGQKLVNVFHRE